MKNKKGNVAVIALIIAIVAITAGVIGFLFAKKSQAPSTPVITSQQPVNSAPTTQQQTAQPTDETANWQIYSNAKYGFELRYPKNYTPSVNDQAPNFYQVSFMDGDSATFYVKVDLSGKKDGSNYHLDNEPVGKTTLGGNQASKFVLEKGYCDGPGCSPAIVAVKTYYNGLNYVANFYGATEISGINEKILSTFKFTDVTTDETANWQTYSNAKYGFEFKYPKDWDKIDGNDGVSLRSPETKKLIAEGKIYESPDLDISISFWNNINTEDAKGGTSVQDRKYDNLTDFLENAKFSTKTKIGEISIGGVRGFEVIIGGIGQNYGIMIEKNGIYELSFHKAYDKAKMNEIDRKILSTFKFTDAAVDETANWQTYKDDVMGFEINYPNDWKVSPSENLGSAFVSFRKINGDDFIGINKRSYYPSDIDINGSLDEKVAAFINREQFLNPKVVPTSNGKVILFNEKTKGGVSPSAYVIGERDLFVMNFTDIQENETGKMSEARSLIEKISSTFKFTK